MGNVSLCSKFLAPLSSFCKMLAVTLDLKQLHQCLSIKPAGMKNLGRAVTITGVLPPGVWTGFPVAVRKPEGRIHWAGTETATQWYAYMDGPVASGERAANEIMH